MRILITLIAILAILTVAAAIYFRTVSMPEEVWHLDPREVDAPTSLNFELRAGQSAVQFDLPADVVAARIDAIATSEGADILAGRVADGWVTYVARSRVMGFPDAVSVRIAAEGDGTQVDIFSRSRFGHSDMGVNTARVERWLAAVTE